MPSVIEPECPWYYGETLAIENEREMVEPFVAKEDDHEWNLLRAYDQLRREIIRPGPVLNNLLQRRKILEQAVSLAVQFHGGAVLAGTLLAYSDGVGVEVVRAPSCQSPMARQNPGKPKAQAEPKPPKPKPAPKPPREKAAPFYTPPVVVREGDLKTTAWPIRGVTVWSVGVLEKILGPRCVASALARARAKIPMMEHPRLFPKLRTRHGGKTQPVSTVSLEGLRALSQFIPPGSKAGQAIRGYLESLA